MTRYRRGTVIIHNHRHALILGSTGNAVSFCGSQWPTATNAEGGLCVQPCRRIHFRDQQCDCTGTCMPRRFGPAPLLIEGTGCHNFWSTLQSRRSFFTPYTPIAFVTDLLLNVGVILLATTLYSSSTARHLDIVTAFLLYIPSSTAGHKRHLSLPQPSSSRTAFRHLRLTMTSIHSPFALSLQPIVVR
jgi:hypothetical protein